MKKYHGKKVYSNENNDNVYETELTLQKLFNNVSQSNLVEA